MRLIFLVLGIVHLYLASPIALAVQAEVSGQFRLRHLDYDIQTGREDVIDTTGLRARAQIDIEIDDRRSFRLTPQATKTFGELSSVESEDASDSVRRTSGDQFQTELGFFEALGKVRFGEVDFVLGRQALVYGDSLVLGHRNWTANGQAFDAIKAEVELGEGQVDLIASKIENNDVSRFSDDATLYGIYYRVLIKDDQEFDVYLFENNEPGRDGARDSLSSGFRFKKTSGAWTFSTENIYQDFHENGRWAYDLNAFASRSFGDGRIFGLYSLASENFDQLYANRHGYNGLIDIVGRRNLQTVSIGASYELSSKWTLKANILDFQRADNQSAAYLLDGVTQLPGDLSEKNIGRELDLLLSFTPAKGERVQAGYMIFRQGDYFQDNDLSKFAYLEYLSIF